MKRATSSPELLISIKQNGNTSLRLQVERGLRSAIQTGKLPVGALLPSTRTLAEDLRVSRGVILEAYDQLLSEGYLMARQGSATRVAARMAEGVPAPTPEPALTTVYRYDFRPGMPDLSLFPRRAWLISTRRVIGTAPQAAFDYPDARGAEPVRTALAAYLNRARATVTRSNQIVMCTGFAQGIRLVCQVLRERGVRRIAVEDPGHADQCADIDAEGLEKIRIPVDDEGLQVDLLDRTDAAAVLVTPSHQYPTGAVLAPRRRSALLAWASQRGAVVIEDDYDAEYRYDREPTGSLQGLAPERVVYIGTASKTLSPALRLAWLALPADLVGDVERAKLWADRGSPTLDQLAFADFVERGELDRHLRRTRIVYRRRRDLLITALRTHLPHLRPKGVAAGLHLMIEMGLGMDENAIVEAAAKRSMRLYGASSYRAIPDAGPPALVLGYGGLEESAIDDGIRQLASLLQIEPVVS